MSLAAFLAESSNIEIHLFESKPEIRAIGAGIAVWKRFWDIFEDYIDFGSQCASRGLRIPPWSEGTSTNLIPRQKNFICTECLKSHSHSVSGPLLRKSDTHPNGVDFSQIPHGPRIIPRDDLLDILHKHAASGRCRIKTNKKVKTFVQDASGIVTLLFEDGTNSTADVLIGADGVRSHIRQHMLLGQDVLSAPQFSGQFAYRMHCPRAEVEKMYPNNVALRGFKIVRAPIDRMCTCN
jgi:salicylate hydroxylase